MTLDATMVEARETSGLAAMPARLSGLACRLRRWIERPARPIDDASLAKSAVIFAPHQDDETLGCGGLVIRKRAAGAPVTIVYLTDGADSHDSQVARAELAAQRREEGVAAARVLGVAESDVIGLDHPDGNLRDGTDRALDEVATILVQRKPAQVFVTSPRDPTADHQAAAQIVQTAVRKTLPQTELFAYPVWYWCYWPFAPGRDVFANHWPARWIASARSLRAMRRAGLLRLSLDGVREQKWAALNEHASQMHRNPNHPDWPTLGDVWGGRFLRCFFDENELFVRLSG